MKYYSLNHNSKKVTFLKATLRGLAPDKGLYFPEEIPRLPRDFIGYIDQFDKNDIAFNVIHPFTGNEIEPKSLKKIVAETLNFEFPLVPIEENVYSLELFHGPTLAFKDVGARFMARCLAHFNKQNKSGKTTILVATSGDTGSAVAHGFLGIEGIDVVILYPKGKVSFIQEKQLTTLGQNITALEVDGVFDDCQKMVKTAFLDPKITQQMQLSSANSINVARWLPQMFYYFLAYKSLKGKKLVFSVPSGNFGNICAGLLAKEMGLPIDHFVASANVNDVVTRFLKTGQYTPTKTISTISNAMDVGDPSNFARIQRIYNDDFRRLKKNLSGYSFTDSETKNAIEKIFKTSEYITDPHGAVGYLGLKKFLEEHPSYCGVFLETAHPVKFSETVERIIKTTIPVPDRIKSSLEQKKQSVEIRDYSDLKSFLLSR